MRKHIAKLYYSLIVPLILYSSFFAIFTSIFKSETTLMTQSVTNDESLSDIWQVQSYKVGIILGTNSLLFMIIASILFFCIPYLKSKCMFFIIYTCSNLCLISGFIFGMFGGLNEIGNMEPKSIYIPKYVSYGILAFTYSFICIVITIKLRKICNYCSNYNKKRML